MNGFRYHMPVDPECPAVEAYTSALYDDPMSQECGCLDEIVESFERRHAPGCLRCRTFGCENIEVVGP